MQTFMKTICTILHILCCIFNKLMIRLTHSLGTSFSVHIKLTNLQLNTVKTVVTDCKAALRNKL